MKTKKFLSVLVAVVVISAVLVVPAFAQGVTPETPQESILQVVKAVGELIVALLVIGIGSERGTQLIKVVWNMIADKLAPVLNLKDKRAFILAAVVAFCITFYFNVDMTQFLQLFDGFDAELVKTVNALLLFFVSTKIHDANSVKAS